MADIIRLKAHIKEHKARKIFSKENQKHFSPDWIVWNENNKLEFIEIKDKPKFTAGSNFEYDAHGLDYRQFKNYMDCYNKLGIKTKLIIFDEEDGCIYWQYINILNTTPVEKKFYLEKSKIIIFSLEYFEKGDLNGST